MKLKGRMISIVLSLVLVVVASACMYMNYSFENFQSIKKTTMSTGLVKNESPVAPEWGQYTVNKNLVLSATRGIIPNTPFQIGPGNAKMTIVPNLRGPYDHYDTYRLGDITSLNGKYYLNLASVDERGEAYSGSHTQSPTQDNFVWVRVVLGKNRATPVSRAK